MSKQPRLDVLDRQRFAEQRIIEQIDLPPPTGNWPHAHQACISRASSGDMAGAVIAVGSSVFMVTDILCCARTSAMRVQPRSERHHDPARPRCPAFRAGEHIVDVFQAFFVNVRLHFFRRRRMRSPRRGPYECQRSIRANVMRLSTTSKIGVAKSPGGNPTRLIVPLRRTSCNDWAKADGETAVTSTPMRARRRSASRPCAAASDARGIDGDSRHPIGVPKGELLPRSRPNATT